MVAGCNNRHPHEIKILVISSSDTYWCNLGYDYTGNENCSDWWISNYWSFILASFSSGLTALLLFLPKYRVIRLSKRRLVLFAWIMVFGSLLPGAISYTATFHLPAGVMAITIAMVPIFIMPIAIFTGHEVFKNPSAGCLYGCYFYTFINWARCKST